MKVVIIQYNAGNVQSVLYALQRIGVNAEVTADSEKIAQADKVIFPGVGHAGSAMEYLKRHHLDCLITSLRQPVLGICLGLQLMCQHSEEGDTHCLGIFDTGVKRFDNSNLKDEGAFKIPQIGWNGIYDLKSQLFLGVKENSFVYFVHSFYAELSEETIATSDYTVPYSAAMRKDNFYGVQFHAEKSAETGAKIIENFINLP
jgi:imidazole glycerol-phosphate synthase subunit HisH